MITLDSTFEAAISKMNPKIRFMVTIDVDTGVSYTFTDGKCSGNPLNTYPSSVLSVSPLSRSVDIFSKSMNIDCATVSFIADGMIRSMITDYGIKGSVVTIKIGTSDIDATHFEDLFCGIVESVRPRDENVIDLKIKTVNRTVIVGEVYPGDWFGKFPPELIEQIIYDTGVSSDWVEDSTFDATSYTSTTSHHVIGRVAFDYFAVLDLFTKIPAGSLIQEILYVCDGILLCLEDGKIRYKQISLSQAVDDSLDYYDDLISEIDVVSLYDNMINKITFNAHPKDPTWNSAVGRTASLDGMLEEGATEYWPQTTYMKEDTDAQSRFGTVTTSGKENLVIEEKNNIMWIDGYGSLTAAFASDSNPGDGNTFSVWGNHVFLMAGCRWETYDDASYPSGSPAQPADAKLSTTRKAYLLIDSEIVECDACAVSTSDYSHHNNFMNSSTMRVERKKAPLTATYTINARGALGTTAAAHAKGAIAYDITIPVYLSGHLQRRVNGAWEIRFKTSIRKYAIQIGDVVTISNTPEKAFSAFGATPLDDTVKWQVTGKKIINKKDSLEIEFTCVFLRQDSPPASTFQYGGTSRLKDNMNSGNQKYQLESATRISPTTLNHAFDGMGATKDAGFNLSLAAGFATGTSGLIAALDEAYGLTMEASKDTYVLFDFASNSPCIITQSLGSAAPDLPDSMMWIAKVVTDGSEITTVTDLRETQAIPGDILKPGTGALSHLNDSGVFDSLANVTTKTLDQVDDGATYLRVTGVSAGHQIQEASVATGAVTENKIGGGAVTVTKIGTGAVTEIKIDTGAVTVNKIGSGAVTEIKLDTGAVTEGKLGTGAVTEGKIGTGAITEGKLGTGAVTAGKIGTSAVTASKVDTQVIDDQHIVQSRRVALNPNPNLLRYRS